MRPSRRWTAWIRENQASQALKGGMTDEQINARIRKRLEPVRQGV